MKLLTEKNVAGPTPYKVAQLLRKMEPCPI